MVSVLKNEIKLKNHAISVKIEEINRKMTIRDEKQSRLDVCKDAVIFY